MHAVVLSPGPSLANLSVVPACDLAIGVNRASLKFATDAWSCGDLPAIEKYHEQVIGSPVLIAGMEAVDNLRDRKIVWRGEVCPKASLLSYCPHFFPGQEHGWVWCSFTTAIVYAGFRGATTIEIFGCDWEGTADWDGTEAGKNRSPDRWRDERQLYEVTRAWLAERGVTVARH